MVGVLIRMKLVVIRNSMTGARASWMVLGGVVGAALAAGVIVLSLARVGHPTVVPDLLATVYLTWMIGWIVGPIWAGSAVLQAEHFALLNIPRRRLAVGLLGAAFVGITAAVTLLAFISLVTYAARLGVVPALLAVPVVVLQVAGVVLLSRVAAVMFGKVVRARTGAALNGVLFGVAQALAQSAWIVLVGLIVSGVLDQGFPAGYSIAVRSAPSGWGLIAVEAAGRGSWAVVLAALGGMVALVAVLLQVWSHTLGEPRGSRPVVRGPRRTTRPPRGLFTGSTGAVLRKELRTWWRDPARATAITAPLTWGLVIALLPLTFGATLLLPWAALLIALMAATFSVNLYGYDGTALWLTLQTGSERVDLRARQWAYLLVFGSITTVVAVSFTAWSGLGWAWPWVLALLPAMLGGGVGLAALFSVIAVAQGPDAQRRTVNQAGGSGDDVGSGFLVFFAGLLPPVPPAAVLLAGTLLDNEAMRWAGVPVGVATGVLLAWWLGRIAYRRLQATGPEMLLLLRTGRPSATTRGDKVEYEISRRSKVIQGVGWGLAWLPLFPQGLVPIVLKLTGNTDVTSWFLAMYLPEPLGWITAVAMVLLGGYLYYLAIAHTRNPTPKRSETPVEDDPADTRDTPARSGHLS